MEAVKRGTCAVGLKGKECVVLGIEKKVTSKLQDTTTTPSKICKIDDHIYLTFAGLSADARILIDKAQIETKSYKLTLGEPATVESATKFVAETQQRYTQSGGVRPFGLATLIVGFDPNDNTPKLFQTEPSGVYNAWKANAIGKSSKTVREFLEKNYEENLDWQSTVKLLLKSLLEVVQVGEKNIEVAVIRPNNNCYKLTFEEIMEYVKEIEDEKNIDLKSKSKPRNL